MKILTALLLMTTAAAAQDSGKAMLAPVVPSEEVKVQALLRAYEANGNSMVGWSMYDATLPRIVKTEKVTPVKVVPASEKNALDAIADMTDPETVTKADICKRHGMRKVTHGDGWRCRK